MKVLFLLTFLICFSFISSTRDLEISMIADVVQSGNKASNIIANLCWKPSMKKKLMSKLFASDNPKSIKFKFSLHSKDETTKEKIVYLLDLRCPESTEILIQANDSKRFSKPYKWFLIRNASFEDAPSELDGLLILPDSEVYIAKYSGNNSFNINLVYKIKRHSDWTVENYGTWSNATGLIRSSLMVVTAAMRRKNLAGETIVTTTVVTDNSTIEDLENLRLPQIDSVTKSAHHQLSALYHFMNATRVLIFTDAWGYFINGSWNGMVGDLVNEKAELLGVVIFITKQRLPVLEYMTCPSTLDIKIIFREPPLSYQSNLYLLPFKAAVWYSLMVLVAVLIVALYVNAYWEAEKNKNIEMYDKTTTLIPNISEVTVFVMSAISQQGNTVEFKGSLGRMVTLILLMVCLFLYTAYSASIVVLLQSSSNQIRTLSDLLVSKLEVGSEDTAYNRYFIGVYHRGPFEGFNFFFHTKHNFKMNVYFNILTIFFWYFSVVLTIPTDNDLRMIADVLQSFNKPSNVVAYICWKASMKKKLISKLSDLDTPKSVTFQFSLDSKDVVMREQTVFLVDMQCFELINIVFEQVNATKKFGKPYRWIIIDNTATLENVLKKLKDLTILPDSEVYVTTAKGTDFDINLIYKIKPNLDWIVETYGIWSPDGGLEKSKFVTEMTAPMRRKNLGRETIVTSMVVNDNSTFEDLENVRYPQIDSVSKSGYQQLSALYDFINATRHVMYTDVWGYYINGSWTGIIGDLVQEKAELPGSVMFITKERLKVVDYLSHPTDLTVKFLFREPPLSYQNNLYLLPFKVAVWYSLGVLVAILIVFMYLNAYWEGIKLKVDEGRSNPDTTLLVPNVSDVTVFVMSAISQQGSSVELKGSLGRCVTLILLLVCLFLYTAYSASIVVLLQASSSQIRTLTDLMNSKLEIGVEDTPYNRHLFATEKEPIRKMIYDKKIAPPGSKPKFYDLDKGVRKLQKEPFAFNCNLGSAYKLIERYFFEHEKCGLQEISFIHDNVPWQACRKGSPYTEIFKVGLLRNAESGLNDRTNRRLFSKKPICSARGGSFVSVSLVDFYPSLLLLLYGMILSVVLLLAELLYHRRTTHTA